MTSDTDPPIPPPDPPPGPGGPDGAKAGRKRRRRGIDGLRDEGRGDSGAGNGAGGRGSRAPEGPSDPTLDRWRARLKALRRIAEPTPAEQAARTRAEEMVLSIEEASLWDPPAGMAHDFGQALKLLFALVARRRGAHWTLSDAEADGLGYAYARLAMKYGASVRWMPELLAGVATVGVILPRREADRVLAEAARAAASGPAQ